MKKLLERQLELRQSGQFLPDHQYALHEQYGKTSYAEATRRSLLGSTKEDNPGDLAETNCSSESSTFAAPNLAEVQLQTCVVAAPKAPVGGLLSSGPLRRGEQDPVVSGHEKQASPISTVLDIYLDNIMANVPQLALCLQEKGFIQSVKLLRTEEIPAGLMQSQTFDETTPFDVITGNPQAEQLFSPKIMETNASTMLRFLKSNCTRDNATYLLRREAGETNIQLYDISAISSQRQREWIWWLAMMSYRFASRLRHLSVSFDDNMLRRSCRERQRSLLHTTLDLLEILSDMDGYKHESLVAAVSENLADTFLAGWDVDEVSTEKQQSPGHRRKISSPAPATSSSSRQPYESLTVDALSKAQDRLRSAIKILEPVLQGHVDEDTESRAESRRDDATTAISVEDEFSSGSDQDENASSDANERSVQALAAIRRRVEPVATQLFGLQHKYVNVSLRLTEIHLRNYYSSSAMQALRCSARGIADSLYLVQLLTTETERADEWLFQLQLQYTWLWEHCGHFARSFAADGLWRDRGHASGDDILSVLLDAENSFKHMRQLDERSTPRTVKHFIKPTERLLEKSKGTVNLRSLSGLVRHQPDVSNAKARSLVDADGFIAVERILARQRLILRDERKVLVAACIAYGKAIEALHQMASQSTRNGAEGRTDLALLPVLQQRLGDACNETGKIMLNELRELLTSGQTESQLEDSVFRSAADVLLLSAQFWFFEGLSAFEGCSDLRNLTLLRLNLCQSFKLKANAVFSKDKASSAHAEGCLQDAASHLQAAHEALHERDTDPATWDMVSEELAATFLVLGVRRRQSLIGAGNLPLIAQTLRLTPGKEKSVVDPMERSLTIYEQLGNDHQAGAAHYQLALFYSKIWTCQRDEAKTREKLSAAFKHYNMAHALFSQSIQGNEATFSVLCIDLSDLYSSVPGEESTRKALLRCLDTSKAFSSESIEAQQSNLAGRAEWFSTMEALASSVEDRVFKSLRTLVKMEEAAGPTKAPPHSYKDLYRAGLQAKLESPSTSVSSGDELVDRIAARLLTLQGILQKLRAGYDTLPPIQVD